MKKVVQSAKSMIGVTLLEILLVLAIAAMIIVMSIRYYQTATIAQETTQLVSTLTAIAAAADVQTQATGGYSTVTSTTLLNLLPPGGLKTPWNANITITNNAGSSMTLNIPGVPPAVCTGLLAQLTANPNFQPTTANSCNAFTYSRAAGGTINP